MGEETEITFKLYEVKEGGEGGGGEKGEVPSVIPPEGALSVGECMSGVIHVTYKNGQGLWLWLLWFGGAGFHLHV